MTRVVEIDAFRKRAAYHEADEGKYVFAAGVGQGQQVANVYFKSIEPLLTCGIFLLLYLVSVSHQSVKKNLMEVM